MTVPSLPARKRSGPSCKGTSPWRGSCRHGACPAFTSSNKVSFLYRFTTHVVKLSAVFCVLIVGPVRVPGELLLGHSAPVHVLPETLAGPDNVYRGVTKVAPRILILATLADRLSRPRTFPSPAWLCRKPLARKDMRPIRRRSQRTTASLFITLYYHVCPFHLLAFSLHLVPVDLLVGDEEAGVAVRKPVLGAVAVVDGVW